MWQNFFGKIFVHSLSVVNYALNEILVGGVLITLILPTHEHIKNLSGDGGGTALCYVVPVRILVVHKLPVRKNLKPS